MGFFSVIKGIGSAIMGSSPMENTVIGLVNKATGLNDLSELPPQDKANFLLEMTKIQRAQSPARRFIAVSTWIMFLFLLVVWSILLIVGNAFDLGWAQISSSTISSMIDGRFGVIVMGVYGFYFGQRIVEAATKK